MGVITPVRYAIALSVVVHVALVLWVVSNPAQSQVSASHPKAVPVTATPAAAPVEPEAMVVALLEDDTAVATSTSPPSVAPVRASTHHIASTATSHAETTATSHPDTTPTEITPTAPGTLGTPKRSYWLSMRTPTEQLMDQLTGGAGGGLGGAPQWGHPPTGEELDAQRETELASIEARNNAELKPDGTGKKSDHKAFSLKVAPDGSVKFKDKPSWQQKSLFFAEFDVYDVLMRKQGMDPYSSYKMKILDETREERYEMGKQYRTQQLAQSGRFMQKNIERLVASVQDPPALKQGLFELWDDCAESGNDELIAGGTAAREQLMGFVRRRFPQDGPDAFTADELARLNQHRTSHATFQPYL